MQFGYQCSHQWQSSNHAQNSLCRSLLLCKVAVEGRCKVAVPHQVFTLHQYPMAQLLFGTLHMALHLTVVAVLVALASLFALIPDYS